VVKAIGGLFLTPSDTGAMPQKIHPSSYIGDARTRLKSKGFVVARRVFLPTRIREDPLLHLVGLRRSLVNP
jgi:hypothetical protein